MGFSYVGRGVFGGGVKRVRGGSPLPKRYLLPWASKSSPRVSPPGSINSGSKVLRKVCTSKPPPPTPVPLSSKSKSPLGFATSTHHCPMRKCGDNDLA